MKHRTIATNRWLSEDLHLGNLCEVSRKVSLWMREPEPGLLRKLGPTLAGFGVEGTTPDPKLTLYRNVPGGDAELIAGQDNWGDGPDAGTTAAVAALAGAFPLDPGNNEAALVVALEPGAYTVVGSSSDGSGNGVVLVEIYEVK